MSTYANDNHEAGLEVISMISERVMAARLNELRVQDDLILALRDALKMGVSVDALSAETGLSPETVRSTARRELTFSDEAVSLIAAFN